MRGAKISFPQCRGSEAIRHLLDRVLLNGRKQDLLKWMI
jgi:hypothetical protein